MTGGVRNKEDEDRADEVEQLERDLGVDHLISVQRNISFQRMGQLLITTQVLILLSRYKLFKV